MCSFGRIFNVSAIHSTFPRTQYGFLNERLMYAMVLLLAFVASLAVHYQVSSVAASSGHSDSQAVPGGIAGRQSSGGVSSAVGASGGPIPVHPVTTADNVENDNAVMSRVQVAGRSTNGSRDQNKRVASAGGLHAMRDDGKPDSEGADAVSQQGLTEPPSDEVTHISNDGNGSVISSGSAGVRPDAGTLPNAAGSNPSSNQDTGAMPDATQEPATQQAAYEELYPGCPRTLPPGSDEQMAAERMQLYGCRYLESCNTATEERATSCTWYLMGATSQPISSRSVDDILAGDDPVKWQMSQGAGRSLF